MKGKGVIFLVDGMAMSSPNAQGGNMGGMAQMKMGQPNNHGLDKLLEAYGFKVGQDFIFEPESNTIGVVNVNGRAMPMNAPVFVVAETQEYKDLSVVAGLRGVVLPYPSSVELVGSLKGGKPNEGKLWPLAQSTAQAWRHMGFFMLTPTTNFEPSGDRGPFGFGYAFEGNLKTAFPAAPAAPAIEGAPAQSAQSAKVRLVMMGDSDFASDEYVGLSRHPMLQAYATGAALMFNAISWAMEDETLTPLRNKTLTPRPITLDSPAHAAALTWANVLGLPLAFCAFGFVRWRVRRARRASLKL